MGRGRWWWIRKGGGGDVGGEGKGRWMGGGHEGCWLLVKYAPGF